MKRNSDYYTKLAKSKGYPARSVFKLKEIQEKYGIIKPRDKILEIGSSPGSWSLYILRELRHRGSILAVDLVPGKISASKYSLYTFTKGNIMDDATADRIASYGSFDVVLSDAAPSTSGNRLVDSYRSYEIANRVLEVGLRVLKKGGNIVIKTLQGGETNRLKSEISGYFTFSKLYKPVASRSESTEIFFIGMNFKS